MNHFEFVYGSLLFCLCIRVNAILTNFHDLSSQNGDYERVQNFLARTSRNAVSETANEHKTDNFSNDV